MKTLRNYFTVLSIFALIIGFSLHMQGQTMAIRTVRTTDKIDNGSNHLHKAKVALEKDNLDAFWNHIKEARLKCPCRYKTHFMKGVAHVKAAHYDAAEKLFELALENATEKGENLDTILYSIAQVYALEGRYDEAMSYINKTAGNIGGLAYYKRGLMNLKAGNPEKAIGQFLEHIRQQADQPISHQELIQETKFSMGLCHVSLGNYRIAEQLLREANAMKENLDVRLAIIDLLFAQNRREEAMKELKKAIAKHMTNSDTRNYLTNLLLNEINVSEALMNNFLTNQTDNYHSSLTKGNVALRKGNHDEAIDNYKKAARLTDNDVQSNNGLATVFFNRGELDAAEEIWGMILEVEPNNSIALEGMGILHFLKESYFVSKQYLTQATEADNRYMLSYDGLLCLGYINILMSSYDEAVQLFTTGINKNKNNEWALAGVGFCKYEQGVYTEAANWFKLALKKNPEIGIFRGYMGVAQFWMSYLGGGRIGTDKYSKALDNLEFAFASGVQNAFIYNALAMAYSEVDRNEDAQRVLAEVRAMVPDNYEFWMNSGNIESKIAAKHAEKGAHDEMNLALNRMVGFYNQAQELGAPSEVYYTNLAYGYVISKQFDKAESYYNLLPENSAIRFNNLGVLYALQGERGKAQLHFEKALKAESEYPMLKLLFDLNLRRVYSMFSNSNSFTSVYHFFLPMEPAKPELSYETNIPVLEVKPEMPADEFQALLYDDRTFCEKKKKTVVTHMKQPDKKHFSKCL